MSRDTSGREYPMKYIVVVAQEQVGGSVGPLMTSYDDRRDAESAYHMELAYGIVSDKLVSDTVAILGTDGQVYAIQRVECKGATETTKDKTTE